MINVNIAKPALKSVKSTTNSIKKKFYEMTDELASLEVGGSSYKKYHGERLYEVEKDRDLDFEIPSVELANRVRFVYEIRRSGDLIVVNITDCANHEYKGIPYSKQFSFSIKP